jgi:hypothetical protein
MLRLAVLFSATMNQRDPTLVIPPVITDATAPALLGMDELTFDFEDGLAIAPSEQGQTTFEDLDSLVAHLAEAYDEAWYANVPFEGGEAVFDSDCMSEVSEALDERCSEELDRLGWR